MPETNGRIGWVEGFRRAVMKLRLVWRTLLLARISFWLVALGAAVLFLPQGFDVVRGLADKANVILHEQDSADRDPVVWSQWVCFLFACFWSGLNAWYWPRLLFKLRQRAERWWFILIVRLLGIVPLAAAFAALAVVAADSTDPRQVSYALAVFGASAVAMAVLLFRRDRIFSGPRGLKRWYNSESRLLNPLKAGLGGTPNQTLTIGDDVFFATTLLLALVMFVGLSIPGLRTVMALTIGSAGLAFGAVGILIALVSAVAWAADRLRVNVLATLAVMFLVFSCTNNNHGIRRIENAQSPARPGLHDALMQWNAHAAPGPIVLVAAAGGASRAGYWTGAVLRALDDRTDGRFSRQVFAISAVSGGSLGAVGYAAWVADKRMTQGCFYDTKERLAFDRAFLGGDYLAPAVAGLLYPDLAQRFLPGYILPTLPDRAASLEEGWEEGWRQAAATYAKGTCNRPGSDRMAQDFQRIWEDSLTGKTGWVPLVLVNGTMVENGKRVLTAPVTIMPDVFEDSYDYFELSPHPIRASTAILNGARFPIVSPAGTIRNGDSPRGRLVDGGYFENGGLETLLDLGRYIEAEIKAEPALRGRRLLIVEIANDIPLEREKGVPPDLARYRNGVPADTTTRQTLRVQEAPSTGAGFLSEVTSIIGGLYGTRTSRGVLAAKRISALNASGLQGGRATFNLSRLNRQGTTLSWSLSLSARDAIDVALDEKKLVWDSLSERRRREVDAQRIAGPLLTCERLGLNQVAAVTGGPAVPPGGTCPGGPDFAASVGVPLKGAP